MRMREEKEKAEKLHATRVAVVATLEREIDQLKRAVDDEIHQRDEARAAVSRAEESAAAAAAQTDAAREECEEKLSAAREQSELVQQQHAETLRVAAQNHELELARATEDYTKKSNRARQLVADKDESVRMLTARVAALQEEISSGGHTHRRILEIAESQAHRDAAIAKEIDMRDGTNAKLQHELMLRDGELATTAQQASELRAEINDLRSVARREGVNMEYLKNIVVQYLSFQSGSSEHQSLMPVLATLLQFTPEDLRGIRQAQSQWAWGRRVKEITGARVR